MSEDEIWRELTAVFRDVFEDADIVIDSESTAEDIEDWDSLSNIQLLIAIERAFNGVKFNTGEVARMRNVGEMVSIIEQRLKS